MKNRYVFDLSANTWFDFSQMYRIGTKFHKCEELILNFNKCEEKLTIPHKCEE